MLGFKRQPVSVEERARRATAAIVHEILVQRMAQRRRAPGSRLHRAWG